MRRRPRGLCLDARIALQRARSVGYLPIPPTEQQRMADWCGTPARIRQRMAAGASQPTDEELAAIGWRPGQSATARNCLRCTQPIGMRERSYTASPARDYRDFRGRRLCWACRRTLADLAAAK